MKYGCGAIVAIALVVGIALGEPGAASLQRGGAGARKANAYTRRPLTKNEQRWLTGQMGKASLEEKIGQMVMVTITARFMNLQSAEFARLRDLVMEQKVGGVALSPSDVFETAILLNRLQELTRVPLLVAADFETGTGMRLNDATYFPWNMAVGATGDSALAEIQGEVTAREARAVGINMVLAPVADVNNNPANPVINARSYGEDPQQVARFVSSFVAGAQTGGVIATAKHFPGHGDTSMDSHIGLPVVDVGRDRLEAMELVPFRAAIRAGVGGVMSAHVALPQIDPTTAPPPRIAAASASGETEFLLAEQAGKVSVPATLSPRILTGMLRDELKFDGLILTDSMRMGGIVSRYSPEDAAVRAVKAGADILLGPPDPALAIRGVRQAVDRGEIPVQQIDRSYERILTAKLRLGVVANRYVDIYDIDEVVSSSKHLRAAEETAERSLTLLRNDQGLIPMSREKIKGVLHVSVTGERLAEPDRLSIGAELTAGLKARVPLTETGIIDQSTRPEETERLLSSIGRYEAIIVSLFIRPRSGRGSITIPELARNLIKEISGRKLKLMVISFGSPYLIEEIPGSPGYLCAYGDYGLSLLPQRAAARALFGEIEISGKLPVTIPGLFTRGSGLEVRGTQKAAEKL